MDTLLGVSPRNHRLLPLSLRMVRTMLSLLLVIAITTELTLSVFWEWVLSALAIYTFVTGIFGRDPLFRLLQFSSSRLPERALDVVSQVECFLIGAICIAAGIVHHNTDSLVIALLPFFGIYPILLCAVKYDLLDHILQTYRRDLRKDHE